LQAGIVCAHRGRSEAALESYLERLEGKQRVKVVCMDSCRDIACWCASIFPAHASSLTAFT
jgi:hypothetical protein